MDEALVRTLLREQHPDLADLELELRDSGWDNVTVRLGDGLAVRLPRRRVAVELLVNEQRWLPVLGPRLPLRVPVPVRTGEPGAGYPWPWSVVPWLPGRSADREPLAADQAPRLAQFLRALHVPAPSGAPVSPFRGVPLHDRDDDVRERLRRRFFTEATRMSLTELWERALRAPASSERRWVHGDLHPRNVLVHDGALVAVIDWGDLTVGDVATDLAATWLLFEAPADRAAFLEAYGPSESAVARARGWALLLGLVLLESGEPRHASIGEATLRRLVPETAATRS